MRVISGSARGKKLECPEGIDIRPTLDRVKESVFNMIAFDIAGATVLDLFSGSGALGIEALSRGASHCVFVDKSSQSIDATQKNIEATRFGDASSVINTDSIDFIKKTDKTFDIIFIDPPYESELYESSLRAIKDSGILSDDGFIVLEYDINITPIFETTGFEIVKDRKYGRVKILIMKE